MAHAVVVIVALDVGEMGKEWLAGEEIGEAGCEEVEEVEHPSQTQCAGDAEMEALLLRQPQRHP